MPACPQTYRILFDIPFNSANKWALVVRAGGPRNEVTAVVPLGNLPAHPPGIPSHLARHLCKAAALLTPATTRHVSLLPATLDCQGDAPAQYAAWKKAL